MKMTTSQPVRATASSMWAILGVVLLLLNGVRRCVPVALQPFSQGLGPAGWCAYVLSGLFFIYAEGYRGFQQKFSPLVVRRALLLDRQQPVLRQVLAPAYAMAFFHANKKRKVVSWALIAGIMVIVAIVKKLPYPYRAILDAGVCAGLSWGMGATVFIYAKSVTTGKAPEIDPCLPQEP
mmetsp:Transcript_96109/g.228899  ORF Transcript_96109/g.228899 Transcript_96109/m.228899 type:complete len:179 (-) Transcript_96109:230-766(-)